MNWLSPEGWNTTFVERNCARIFILGLKLFLDCDYYPLLWQDRAGFTFWDDNCDSVHSSLWNWWKVVSKIILAQFDFPINKFQYGHIHSGINLALTNWLMYNYHSLILALHGLYNYQHSHNQGNMSSPVLTSHPQRPNWEDSPYCRGPLPVRTNCLYGSCLNTTWRILQVPISLWTSGWRTNFIITSYALL